MLSKLEKITTGKAKLSQAFELSRPTLQLGGVAATDPRFAVAAVGAGIRVLEPNHTAISCARAIDGRTSMRAAYEHKHELEFDLVLEVVRTIRRVIPEHTFIICAAPGTFDEVKPRFEAWQAEELSEAGVDGLFIEKDEYREVERLAHIAHGAGLITQAAFQLRSKDEKTAVISIDDTEGARGAARRLKDIGVDIVGLRFSGIFNSLSAGEIAPQELECLSILVSEVPDANMVYAGVNANNLPAIAETGVRMVGLASAVDDLVYDAMIDAIKDLRY